MGRDGQRVLAVVCFLVLVYLVAEAMFGPWPAEAWSPFMSPTGRGVVVGGMLKVRATGLIPPRAPRWLELRLGVLGGEP